MQRMAEKEECIATTEKYKIDYVINVNKLMTN
jgi:hypothetical protein